MENNIYSSVPEDLLNRQQKDYQTRQLILQFLKNYPDKFFKATKLAEYFSLPKKSTQVQVRHLITQLIEIDEQPIISTSKGFAYTKNPMLLKEYAESLEQRRQGITRRINKIWVIHNRLRNATLQN